MSKLKFLLMISLAMSSIVTASAQDKKCFMWKIESETSKMYLVGSIHVANISIYPLPAVMENAFKESDVLAVEVNLNNVNPWALAAKMVYPDGQTLKENVSEKTYQTLLERYKKVNMPEIYFSKMKPWAAIMTLSQLEMKQTGLDPEFGIDMYFLDKAKDNKTIDELESFDSQLAIFDEFDKVSDIYVESSLEEIDTSMVMADNMIKYWKEGNVREFEKLVNASSEGYPEIQALMAKLNDDRNIGMTRKIEKWLTDGKTYFVIAGAAHLIGEKGILNMLKQKGKYKITQQ